MSILRLELLAWCMYLALLWWQKSCAIREVIKTEKTLSMIVCTIFLLGCASLTHSEEFFITDGDVILNQQGQIQGYIIDKPAPEYKKPDYPWTPGAGGLATDKSKTIKGWYYEPREGIKWFWMEVEED